MNFRIQWHETLPSTNTFLKELVEREPDLPEGIVIAARQQTAGRGRRGRIWNSKGENLTFSVLVRGLTDPKKAPSATLAAAVAVAELLEAEGLQPSLKWPNDVFIGGKKICGILCETVSGALIIGIGLNVNMESSNHLNQSATSLLIETGTYRDVGGLLEKLLLCLSIRTGKWKEGGFCAFRNDWEARVPMLGKNVTVRDGETERTGFLAGFGNDGELLLRDETGAVSAIWAGDLLASHCIKAC